MTISCTKYYVQGLLSILVISQLFATQVTAQETQVKKEKKFLTYVSVGPGISSTRDLFGTLELGCWGVKKPVMYGVSLDVVKHLDSIRVPADYWFGLKPYYQLGGGENYSFFAYFCPKIKLNNLSDYLIECGGGAYARFPSSKWYIGTFLGFQSGPGYTLIPSISLNVTYAK
jgi:hypothetical protein